MSKLTLRPDAEHFSSFIKNCNNLSEEEKSSLLSIVPKELEIDDEALSWKLQYEGANVNRGLLAAATKKLAAAYSLRSFELVCLDVEKPAEKAKAGKKKVETLSDAKVIYGKKITKPVRPMENVTEEENDVVVEGSVVHCEARETKTGMQILSIMLSDDTDGLTVKMRFGEGQRKSFPGAEGQSGPSPKKECEDLQKKISEGDIIRIQGNVTLDTFENNELTMSRVKGMMKLPRTLRMDDAEEKRVELHCHTMYSEMDGITDVEKLVFQALNWGHKALAITDHGVVQAFPAAQKALDAYLGKLPKDKPKPDFKFIFGMEGYLWSGKAGEGNHHIILLAKNEEGLRNLYKMVTLSHLTYYGNRGGRSRNRPRLTKSLINQYRQGIIVGSACSAGEIYSSILAGKSREEQLELAKFYDYLELQPVGNNNYLIRDEVRYPDIKNEDDLRKINKQIYSLGQELGKMVVATCDVHFLNPEDALARTILQASQKYADSDSQAPLFFHTTKEMLEEFSYFGEEIAKELVITNPLKISESVSKFSPVPDEEQLYAPAIPGAEDKIKNMVYERAKSLYGDPLPEIVEQRLQTELKSIIGNGYAVLYYIAHLLVKKSNEDGYIVGSRGSVGSSFVATLLGITEVNPLKPHYRCKKCRYSDFDTPADYGSGFDLEPKKCPNCGEELYRDGHNIPFAVFLGFKGDKVPDIDLNFSGEYQPQAHKYTEELFGRDNVCRAGTIGTVKDRTAYGYVKNYFEEKNKNVRRAFIEGLIPKLIGVKRTTGQHPGGIVVIPRNLDIHLFSPMQHPANDIKTDIVTTHFDFHSINDRIVKLDILGHDDPTMIKRLESILGVDTKDFPYGDKETMSIFCNTEALGVTPEQIGSKVGTFGIPECGTKFVRDMLYEVQPHSFNDLLRVSGYSHGTDVWLNNAQDLLKQGFPTSETISTRDEIMTYLINKSVPDKTAFDIMEYCRKGKAHKMGMKPEFLEAMQKAEVPETYIKSCCTVQYLFPKAHATAYVIMAYRIAYCKVHYPEAFYAAYFSVRAPGFDYNIVRKGKKFIKDFIEDVNERGKLKKASATEQDTVVYLELVREMEERGYKFAPIDLYKADADNFLVTEEGIMPSLSAIGGVGSSAAWSIVEARKEGEFISVEDLQNRAKIGAATVSALKEAGVLDGLPESSQMDLFSF